MKNLIDEIDFKYIEKLSLNKCFELDLIPIKKEDFVYIICDNSKKNYIDRLNLIYGLPIKILEINEDEFLKLKHMIFLELNENVENIIIEESINDRASDIHFEPSRGGVNIRFRIDGLLVRRYKISYEIYEKVISRIKNNSNLDITEKRKPQDGKMKFKLNNNEYNLRVSIIKTINGEKLVIRILREGLIKLDFRDLTKEELEKDSNMLSNNKMKEMAYKHLINGDITYIDYIDFIEEEEDYNDQYKIL
ncbi:ATPase, T2SS/T4P/T4SS family [uncultured Clostridium sp.]|uniref:ATPase, T2SS/T4P/T4SS family n=1 Tax=uncultured Clostridium sp. TaxID=59620 RepID=UPI002585CA48|nr:ATPase, T2SS/T4P/T4SS family [uncultured Clostridium sp.]